MVLKVWNKLLATGKVHDQMLTDEALEQLRNQLVGAGVYQDYFGPTLITIPYSPDDPGLREGRSQVLIGHVKAVEGDQMTIALTSDEFAGKIGEEMIAKIDMIVESSRGEDGSITVDAIEEVLGICLVEKGGTMA